MIVRPAGAEEGKRAGIAYLVPTRKAPETSLCPVGSIDECIPTAYARARQVGPSRCS